MASPPTSAGKIRSAPEPAMMLGDRGEVLGAERDVLLADHFAACGLDVLPGELEAPPWPHVVVAEQEPGVSPPVCVHHPRNDRCELLAGHLARVEHHRRALAALVEGRVDVQHAGILGERLGGFTSCAGVGAEHHVDPLSDSMSCSMAWRPTAGSVASSARYASTGRPLMPPAALMSSTMSSAMLATGGPNTPAGPLLENRIPMRTGSPDGSAGSAGASGSSGSGCGSAGVSGSSAGSGASGSAGSGSAGAGRLGLGCAAAVSSGAACAGASVRTRRRSRLRSQRPSVTCTDEDWTRRATSGADDEGLMRFSWRAAPPICA